MTGQSENNYSSIILRLQIVTLNLFVGKSLSQIGTFLISQKRSNIIHEVYRVGEGLEFFNLFHTEL